VGLSSSFPVFIFLVSSCHFSYENRKKISEKTLQDYSRLFLCVWISFCICGPLFRFPFVCLGLCLFVLVSLRIYGPLVWSLFVCLCLFPHVWASFLVSFCVFRSRSVCFWSLFVCMGLFLRKDTRRYLSSRTQEDNSRWCLLYKTSTSLSVITGLFSLFVIGPFFCVGLFSYV